jgi:hypothetical protein
VPNDTATKSTSIEFAFRTEGSGNVSSSSRFECSLDEKPFLECTSPTRYDGLESSSHVFTVRLANVSGIDNEPLPSVFIWSVAKQIQTALPAWHTIATDIDDKTYTLRYQIIGGNISSISPNIANATLRVSLEATSEGILTIELPQDIIQSTQEGTDIEYTVLVDGKETAIEEQSSSNNTRTLVIDFNTGAREITIIGTSIVPEFPMPILVVSATVGSLAGVLALINRIRLGRTNS